MKIYTYLSVFLFVCIISAGCNPVKDTDKDKEKKVEVKPKGEKSVGEMPVRVVELQPSEMTHDIMSNGKIVTAEIAELYFDRSEPIINVWVREGQHVRKGDRIARLDSYRLENELSKLIPDKEKAMLDLKDVLIGQGYDPDNNSSIPDEVLRLARIRSGLDKIEMSIAQTKEDIRKCTLLAPCSGKVADVKIKRYGVSKSSEIACRILNDHSMAAEFTLLEDELPFVKTGDRVEISSFATDDTYKGRITEINPAVDDKGLVRVKASLESAGGATDGMNARIRIRKSLGKKLSVPKSAVVLRSGKEVVFTYENGKAIWNYVSTGVRNLENVEITEGLEAGQKVIVDGNENLAHNSAVIIKKS